MHFGTLCIANTSDQDRLCQPSYTRALQLHPDWVQLATLPHLLFRAGGLVHVLCEVANDSLEIEGVEQWMHATLLKESMGKLHDTCQRREGR